MTKYIIQMVVYTLATVGVLLLAYVAYKKAMQTNGAEQNTLLKISDIIRLPDRKALYVVDYREERFLIGASANSLNLISKLKKDDVIKKDSVREEIIERNFIQKKDTGGSLLKKLSDRNREKRGNY